MFRALILTLILNSSSAVMYHLNDTEYARMPPLWELASYSRCMSQHGTYCVLQLSLEPGDNHQLMDTILNYSAHTLKHYNHRIIERGVCVTETCREYITGRTEDLKAPLEACLNSRVRRAWGVGARVSALHYCERHDERARSDAWDGAVRAALLALVAINAGGSLYDYYLRQTHGTKTNNVKIVILSFSVIRNWERLTNIEPLNAKSQDMQFIHGIRMISSLSTIILHVLMGLTIGYTKNPHDIEKTFEKPFYFLLYNGLMIVQLFFFISGFLKNYEFQEDIEKRRSLTIKDFPKIMALRLSRLVPALSAVLALATSWLRLAGSGPLWRLFLSDSLAADCRACWWHHLLFINNYTQRGKYCLMQTWHLAAEMQVFAASVLAYLVSPRLLFPLLALGAAAPPATTLLHDLDAVIITPEFFRTWENPAQCLQRYLGHNNLACYILGMLTAARLYRWQKRGGHLADSSWWALIQYASVATIPLLMYSGRWFYSDGERAGLGARVAYVGALQPVISAVCALAAFAFFSRTTTHIKRLLSWRGWVVPSRLSYCVFLIHMPLIQALSAARAHLTYYSFYNVMVSYVLVVSVTFLLAIPLHLTVEAPFTTLFKQLLNKSSNATVASGTKDLVKSETEEVMLLMDSKSNVKRRNRIHS